MITDGLTQPPDVNVHRTIIYLKRHFIGPSGGKQFLPTKYASRSSGQNLKQRELTGLQTYASSNAAR
jgi:hypothetical protein